MILKHDEAINFDTNMLVYLPDINCLSGSAPSRYTGSLQFAFLPKLSVLKKR
jgi:hypothetical protein